MRVIVAGSRSWSDRDTIEEVIVQLPADSIVVHGGAPGADFIAANVALENGLTVEQHLARWSVYGKKAGPIRNQAMVDAGADLAFIFPLADSVGTWDLAERAEKAGIPVENRGYVRRVTE